jgi:DNA-binding NarL/FixJ family response regulator
MIIAELVKNGLDVLVADNDSDLEEKIKSVYPKFVFMESCFHDHGTDVYVHKLAKRNRHLRIVVWTAFELKPRSAARFIEAGADSFLSLRDTEGNVKKAISQISVGQYYYPADVGAIVDKDFDDTRVGKELTDRELVILKMAVRGKSNDEISKVLQIAVCTIKTHKRALYRKCGGSTLLDALRNGLKKGILTDEDIV